MVGTIRIRENIFLNSKILLYVMLMLSASLQAQTFSSNEQQYVQNFPDYTEADADDALTAFNACYYSTTRNLYFEQSTRTGKVSAIWTQAIFWDMAMNAYELTNDAKYLKLSESGFERVWSGSKVLKDKGSYDPVNGGMYWAWDQKNPEGSPLPTMGKMACINYPTVIGAMTLYNTTKNPVYFNKAKEIYLWARNNLFDKEIGRVADSKHGSGNFTN